MLDCMYLCLQYSSRHWACHEIDNIGLANIPRTPHQLTHQDACNKTLSFRGWEKKRAETLVCRHHFIGETWKEAKGLSWSKTKARKGFPCQMRCYWLNGSEVPREGLFTETPKHRSQLCKGNEVSSSLNMMSGSCGLLKYQDGRWAGNTVQVDSVREE